MYVTLPQIISNTFVTGGAGVVTGHLTLTAFPGVGMVYRLTAFGARLAYNTPAANQVRISLYRDNPAVVTDELWGTVLANPSRGSDHVVFAYPGIQVAQSNQRVLFESQGAVAATGFVVWLHYYIDTR